MKYKIFIALHILLLMFFDLSASRGGGTARPESDITSHYVTAGKYSEPSTNAKLAKVISSIESAKNNETIQVSAVKDGIGVSHDNATIHAGQRSASSVSGLEVFELGKQSRADEVNGLPLNSDLTNSSAATDQTSTQIKIETGAEKDIKNLMDGLSNSKTNVAKIKNLIIKARDAVIDSVAWLYKLTFTEKSSLTGKMKEAPKAPEVSQGSSSFTQWIQDFIQWCIKIITDMRKGDKKSSELNLEHAQTVEKLTNEVDRLKSENTVLKNQNQSGLDLSKVESLQKVAETISVPIEVNAKVEQQAPEPTKVGEANSESSVVGNGEKKGRPRFLDEITSRKNKNIENIATPGTPAGPRASLLSAIKSPVTLKPKSVDGEGQSSVKVFTSQNDYNVALNAAGDAAEAQVLKPINEQVLRDFKGAWPSIEAAYKAERANQQISEDVMNKRLAALKIQKQDAMKKIAYEQNKGVIDSAVAAAKDEFAKNNVVQKKQAKERAAFVQVETAQTVKSKAEKVIKDSIVQQKVASKFNESVWKEDYALDNPNASQPEILKEMNKVKNDMITQESLQLTAAEKKVVADAGEKAVADWQIEQAKTPEQKAQDAIVKKAEDAARTKITDEVQKKYLADHAVKFTRELSEVQKSELKALKDKAVQDNQAAIEYAGRKAVTPLKLKELQARFVAKPVSEAQVPVQENSQVAEAHDLKVLSVKEIASKVDSLKKSIITEGSAKNVMNTPSGSQVKSFMKKVEGIIKNMNVPENSQLFNDLIKELQVDAQGQIASWRGSGKKFDPKEFDAWLQKTVVKINDKIQLNQKAVQEVIVSKPVLTADQINLKL